MIKQSYEVELLVNGKPLKEYMHEGKVYIEGRKDTKFSLRFRNNSSERKLFIPSIDGLSVMNGKDASYNSSGYIVRPYSTVTIDGWRKSDSEVAEFYFSTPRDSYGSRKGKGINLGVIGCAVFSEKLHLPVANIWPFTTYTIPTPGISTSNPEWQYMSLSSQSTCSIDQNGKVTMENDPKVRALYANSEGTVKNVNYGTDLGTGWGDDRKSEVVSVDFDREASPSVIFSMLYNTREQLEKLGINFKREPLYIVPQAFPGEYCEPPKDR
jgi:hypothetical protein